MLTTGVDIIEIPRIQRVLLLYGSRFLSRIFTQGEIDYCRERPPNLAGRFAAKEAMMKALGTGVRGVGWRDIEVVRHSSGAPSIAVGVLPILSTAQIRRFTALCGAKIPPDLDKKLERYADDDDAVRELGIEWATEQVRELWDNGVAGVHFYVLNRSYSVSNILDNLSLPGHTVQA